MCRFALSCSTALLALGLATPSQASVFLGNPKLGFHLERPQGDLITGTVVVDRVEVEHCDGTVDTYVLDEIVDPVTGHTVTISGGDLCNATWFWSSDFLVEGDGSQGTFEVLSDEPSTTVDLEDLNAVALPWQALTGNPGSPSPKLHPSID